MKRYNKYLGTAKRAAIKAGKYLISEFGNYHQPKFKTSKDLGLSVDKLSEKIILDIIKIDFPEHNMYAEESGEISKGSEFTWYIDPLDGTNNYFCGIPYFGISLSLVFNNEIIIGLVFNPVTEEMFYTAKNTSSYLNKRVIDSSVFSIKNLSKSTISYVVGHAVSQSNELSDKSIYIERKLQFSSMRLIKTWAPSLDWCLLASGRIGGLISFESELEDQLAGILIAQNAGIEINDFNGGNYSFGVKKLVASNKLLKSQIVKVLA